MMKNAKSNKGKKIGIVSGLALCLAFIIGFTAWSVNGAHQVPMKETENITENETPLFGGSDNENDALVAEGNNDNANDGALLNADTNASAGNNGAQNNNVVVPEEPTVEEPTVEEPAVEEPAEEEPAVEEPAEEEPAVEESAEEEPAVEEPAEEEPAVEEPAEEEPEAPAYNASINWLYEQLFKEGSTVNGYFAVRNGVQSMDSTGTNFGVVVCAELEAAGLKSGSWRIYSPDTKASKYNVFWTEADITTMEKGDKIDEVIKVSNYEYGDEAVKKTGTATVSEKKMPGEDTMIKTINAGQFEEAPVETPAEA